MIYIMVHKIAKLQNHHISIHTITTSSSTPGHSY